VENLLRSIYRFRKAARLLFAVFAWALPFWACDEPADDGFAPPSSQTLAFPDAQGWAARTPAGRGGQILRVTTLNRSGAGSFQEAVQTAGPRIVVFEVGGVIDLHGETVPISEPFLTVAGQTAPSPGITFIRGGITISTHDVVIQHMAVRPGENGAAKRSGWEIDAISTLGGAHDVIIDHCSLTWATDENLTASGPRFAGNDTTQWRQGTSHGITFSNNIIAEGLANSTHSKGEHSKGTLVHDNVTEVLIVGNLFSCNMERSPLFKGGASGVVVNNYIYNPGRRAIHYNLIAEEWRSHLYQIGQVVMVGNVMRAGPSTANDITFLMFGGSGDLHYFAGDNIAVDRIGNQIASIGRYTTTPSKIIRSREKLLWPHNLEVLPSHAVQDSVLRNAGARPWDRDPIDRRIIADVIEGRGAIIDSEEEVGGYPEFAETRQPFDSTGWDLRFMTRFEQ
jgi:pectate lyase